MYLHPVHQSQHNSAAWHLSRIWRQQWIQSESHLDDSRTKAKASKFMSHLTKKSHLKDGFLAWHLFTLEPCLAESFTIASHSGSSLSSSSYSSSLSSSSSSCSLSSSSSSSFLTVSLVLISTSCCTSRASPLTASLSPASSALSTGCPCVVGASEPAGKWKY